MMVHRFVRGSWFVGGLCFIGTTSACSVEPAPDNNISHNAQDLVSEGTLDCSAGSASREANACTPVVIVVRHAEDTSTETVPHLLTTAGNNHAQLYINLIDDYVFAKSHKLSGTTAESCACPVGRVLAIDPAQNTVNRFPSSNPYQTVLPLARHLNLTIEVSDSAGVPYTGGYAWGTAARLSLLTGGARATSSTVIGWDKQGLNPTDADVTRASMEGHPLSPPGLLLRLPSSFPYESATTHFTPERNHFYVFAQQDATDGKFAVFKYYHQCYSFNSSDSGSWFTTTFLENSPTSIGVDSQP